MNNKYKDIINYIQTTPNNTNTNILNMMFDTIDNNEGEDGSSLAPSIYYYPESDLDDFIGGLENPENLVPFSLIVTQSDDDPEKMMLTYIHPLTAEQKEDDWSKGIKILAIGSWLKDQDGSLNSQDL